MHTGNLRHIHASCLRMLQRQENALPWLESALVSFSATDGRSLHNQRESGLRIGAHMAWITYLPSPRLSGSSNHCQQAEEEDFPAPKALSRGLFNRGAEKHACSTACSLGGGGGWWLPMATG
jgi:hypothetical protein